MLLRTRHQLCVPCLGRPRISILRGHEKERCPLTPHPLSLVASGSDPSTCSYAVYRSLGWKVKVRVGSRSSQSILGFVDHVLLRTEHTNSHRDFFPKRNLRTDASGQLSYVQPRCCGIVRLHIPNCDGWSFFISNVSVRCSLCSTWLLISLPFRKLPVNRSS